MRLFKDEHIMFSGNKYRIWNGFRRDKWNNSDYVALTSDKYYIPPIFWTKVYPRIYGRIAKIKI